MNITNKTIWITGASSGIGKALALALSKKEVKLILSARKSDQLEAVRLLCQNPEDVKILPLDLAMWKKSAHWVKAALGLFDGVDILINNAGISQRSLAVETDLEVDERIFRINYFGTVALTKSLLPHFIEKKAGHVVVITSVVGRVATPFRSSYSASKHALHGFFDSLRAEIYDDNISVTLICPGFVNTNVSKNALMGDGTEQGTLDKATANGLSSDYFAKKAIKVIQKEKQEAVIGGALEVLAVYLKRFFPLILAKMLRKVNVT